ncbi:MAG: hypothetical protein ACK46Q_02875 [Hyphomonas sp.]
MQVDQHAVFMLGRNTASGCVVIDTHAGDLSIPPVDVEEFLLPIDIGLQEQRPAKALDFLKQFRVLHRQQVIDQISLALRAEIFRDGHSHCRHMHCTIGLNGDWIGRLARGLRAGSQTWGAEQGGACQKRAGQYAAKWHQWSHWGFLNRFVVWFQGIVVLMIGLSSLS